MKVGLVDVDGHNFPNLALMKISTYHKQKSHEVEFVNALFGHYDLVYQAKVFDFTPDYNEVINAKEIIKGGSGYDLKNTLPEEIENCYPDYSLYGVSKAYGYLTRGCPRNCPFCIVGKKEGLKSYKVADLKQFWNGQKDIKLLDPNLLACKERIELLKQLADSKANIDFTQGLDIRFVNDEVAHYLSKINISMLHFAWDLMKYSDRIIKNLEYFKTKTKLDPRKLRVYVLTNYNTTLEEDLFRVYKLKEMKYDPYIMIFDKPNAPEVLRKLQRWVNNKFVFKTANTFEDYLKYIKRSDLLRGVGE